jgi:hypothetical protein
MAFARDARLGDVRGIQALCVGEADDLARAAWRQRGTKKSAKRSCKESLRGFVEL